MFQIFKEHKNFGKQIFLLAKNDLIKTYKGAVIGPFWSVVKPVFTLFIYWFAMSIGVRKSSTEMFLGENVQYFVFLLAGFVPWFFINDTILLGSKSLRTNSQFVTKIAFPVSTVITFTTLSRMFVNVFLTLLMYVTLFFLGVSPSIYNLQFFFYAPLMFVFFLALTWSTAPMAAFSKDFENMISSFMTAFFWFSGIIYNSYAEKLGWFRKFMYFNPINYFVNGYRKTFFAETWFFENTTENLIFFLEFAFIILIGMFNYNRLRKKLPDVL